MKHQATARTLYEVKRVKPNQMDLVIERLADSEEFWSLIKGYAGLVTPDFDHNGKVQGRAEFLADLTAEIEYQNERLSEDLEESNDIERRGGE